MVVDSSLRSFYELLSSQPLEVLVTKLLNSASQYSDQSQIVTNHANIQTPPISKNQGGLPDEIESFLSNGQPERALKKLRDIDDNSNQIQNAIGVCLLRIGEYQEALDIFLRLVKWDALGGFMKSCPLVYKKNFMCTVLCLGGHEAFVKAFLQLNSEQLADEGVRRLEKDYLNWEKESERRYSKLPLYKRFARSAGLLSQPVEAIPLSFTPGELE